ncbi:MAG: sulfite exporter TauE/SafE family protein [Pseudomonadota bacterium]|nr:sulfite exporter TauE/SafE family protein [Pseudomonadota bacterium]
MITLIIAGAFIGFIVGVTGVGGGSLMTPFLLWIGTPANVAVGTDLLYAAMTKSSGIIAHHRQNHVRWKAVLMMASTSIPGSMITLYILQTHFPESHMYESMIKLSLGIMLLATGLLLGFQTFFKKAKPEAEVHAPIPSASYIKLAFVGLPLGVLVTLSSVGAGVVGTMLLMLLLPQIKGTEIVGTDLAHAVPLTFVAGIGHYFMLGNLDWELLGCLLLGSIPAVYLGSMWSKHIPERVLRVSLSICLIMIGGMYCIKSAGAVF